MKRRQKNIVEKVETEVVKEWKYLNKIKIKDENNLLFVSFVIVITGLLVINTLYVITKSDRITNVVRSVTDPTPTERLTSQQKAVSSAYAISISNVTEQAKNDPAFPLGENETVLILDLSVTNQTSAEQTFYPVNQLYVRDDEGGYYTLHASSNITNPISVGEIQPGQTLSGQVSFYLPKRIANPYLYVDLGWDNLVPVVYDVMK